MADYYYPMKNLTSSENLTAVAQYMNEITGDLFWLVVVFAAWIIVFMALYRQGREIETFTSTSFIVSIMTYLLAAMQLITAAWVIIPTIVTVFGVLAMYGKGD